MLGYRCASDFFKYCDGEPKLKQREDEFLCTPSDSAESRSTKEGFKILRRPACEENLETCGHCVTEAALVVSEAPVG